MEKYWYDANGQRVKKQNAAGEFTYYVNQFYEMENGTVTSYFFRDDERIAKETAEGMEWYLSDHLGSTTLLINERGKNWRPTFGSKVFDATRYEGKTTSGYFIVYRTPFLETRGDYFITYYGTTNTIQFQDQNNDLMYLIARSYYFSEGSVTALD